MNFLNYIFGIDPEKKKDEKFKMDLKKKLSEDRKRAMNRRSFLTGLAVTPFAVKALIDEKPIIPREEAGFELDKSITQTDYSSIMNARSFYIGNAYQTACTGTVANITAYPSYFKDSNTQGYNNSKL